MLVISSKIGLIIVPEPRIAETSDHWDYALEEKYEKEDHEIHRVVISRMFKKKFVCLMNLREKSYMT